ncbi:tRNA (adenosine(37)-N6)-threonylcarbamoyltransferase complex ATPase subunit type 1 TsaE [Salegentibacter sp. F188]|uniref:tRNA threonylcarbamoyladenosine biosynthesis protein TsaE n=1 Tax=Autumnicola patrickiae TaxID=3075591 RepID=A0ABU3E3N7_9FLAO|nr:tRNA (adenosine(37)-N6)-threonylcarbamoyltransferase complex ATPase subunit type 1 TsaE [Salegentibacter sp. F188]MDT0690520.1 tRNA (adenosine(37)-N6)-threonylcarbamoyltransferase complex ATPase subunit type 1 TsaE [Salegentibacter sp. F188]
MSLTYDLDKLDMAVNHILDHTKSKTLLFYGEMGAGKTTLIRAFVAALGAEEAASSPTFSLVNEYLTPKGPIYHFDFYRINSETEALDMGIEDYLDSPAWKLIEWPQKIEGLLDENVQKVEISVKSEELRLLTLC